MQNIADRLKQARLASGLSQRALAEKAGPLSAMAISKYEKNQATPGSDVLLRLAKALGVKFEYFFRPVEVKLTKPEYRRHSGFSEKQRSALENRILEKLERYLAVEEVFGPNSFPSFHNEKLDFEIKEIKDAERAADLLRKKWHLGGDPIDNVCETLEDHGVKVILIEEDNRKFDGFSAWANKNIAVIAVKDQKDGDRLRFDLAHELSHLLLKIGGNLDPERACHRFAAAFLVPEEAVRREFPLARKRLSFEELYLLKHKWGFSMQAWLRRLLDSNIISKTLYTQACIEFGKQGWRKKEPGASVKPERTNRFVRITWQALSEGLISYSRASELLGEPADEVRRKISWPEEVEVA